MYASYTIPGCFSERVCWHYILATRVCKFLHARVASYTRVHASKISTRVFVSAVCVSHACGLRVTHVGHACHTRGPFKL